jgi:hypothetical protein
LTINGFGCTIHVLKLEEWDMAYTVFQHNQNYGPRKGLEGPFHYPSGAVLYYDPKAGQYWDPRTDFYVSNQEVSALQNQIFDRIRG